jgi:hypothetical protein
MDRYQDAAAVKFHGQPPIRICDEMPARMNVSSESVCDLPPLILHPFNERVPPAALLENSKAALMLSGLIPGDGTGESELTRRLLAGRSSEVRMLFFVGKDIFRWIGQCMESTARYGGLAAAELRPQSFANLLVDAPPPAVNDKLVRWGVADHAAIFARAVGLNSVFAEPPTAGALSPDFLRNYHRYADALYRAFLESEPHMTIDSRNFRFDLYASGEYSRMLESEWNSEP